MTRETRTKTEFRRKEVERTEYEVEEYKEEYEVTKCNWCGQEYGDDEDVEFSEFVREPRVSGVPTKPIPINELSEFVLAFELVGEDSIPIRMGNPMGAQLEESEGSVVEYRRHRGSLVSAINQAMEEYLDRVGAPRQRRDFRDVDIRAAKAHPSQDELPDIAFGIDVDPEIKGEKGHVCEYCRQKLEW